MRRRMCAWRLLISGDHVLGRVTLYFDYGWTPDPVGEFLQSLDRVAPLDARLALSGHGKPFTDVPGHVDATRKLVRERLEAVRSALARSGPTTAFEIARGVYGDWFNQATATTLLRESLCLLAHLELRGEAQRIPGEPEHWALTSA
jgi:glyoxylase-like metal-dependent hydrolase (beta-lactamase superfamily II)